MIYEVKMVQVTIKKTFLCDIKKIWDIITNNEDFLWRSDLAKIDIIDDTHFIEYAKNNYPTYFTITKKEKYKEYCFDIENTNMKGKWIGLFRDKGNGMVELEFTEEIEVNNIFMKVLAKPYLKKQQKRYMNDLEKEVMK